jgi:hypothetical protein
MQHVFHFAAGHAPEADKAIRKLAGGCGQSWDSPDSVGCRVAHDRAACRSSARSRLLTRAMPLTSRIPSSRRSPAQATARLRQRPD